MYVLPDDAKAGGGVENTNRIIYITKEQKDFIMPMYAQDMFGNAHKILRKDVIKQLEE